MVYELFNFSCLEEGVLIILVFPKYFKLEEVKNHSYYINEYVSEDILENMRELYKHDKNELNKLRKELYIRGIGFTKELQNNFLKGINYNLYPYIKVNDEKGRYKHFPFELFGLTQIVSDLKINSDKFFNYIPINGFDKYIPHERKELFISKLEEYEFDLIYEKDDISKKVVNADLNMLNYIPESVFPHFIKFCNARNFDITNINEALKYYKNTKGTRVKTYEKLYQYCIDKELILPNGTTEYNLYNSELNQLLSSCGFSYLQFMNEYFSESNLLLDRPYEYGKNIIKKIYENYNIEHKQRWLNLESKLTKLKKHVNYELIKELCISDVINFYALSEIFVEEKRPIKELGTEFYDNKIIEILLEFLETLPDVLNIKGMIKDIISDKEFRILKDRSQGITLEEIAKGINITRERVRQIEAKAKRNLKASTDLTTIINFILFKYRKKTIIQLSSVLKFLNLDFELCFILEILLEDNTKYALYKESNLLITYEAYTNIHNEIEWYVSNNHLVIPINDLEFIHEETMIFATKLLNEFNYKLVNNNFVQSKISIVSAIEYIMYLYKDDIFINNAEGYELLKNRIKTIFDRAIDSNPRALFARVADATNVILIDRNAFKYEDFENIDGEFLTELNKLVNEELTQSPYADPRIIFKNNSELMEKNKIYSYSHLYSVIKNFYSDDFNVGHQNTLYIYPKESNKLTASDILLSYLRSHSKVEIDVILKDLKWKRIKLEQMVPRLDNVVLNGNQEVILIEGIENEDNYNTLYYLIKDEVEKGYLVTADTYFKVMFDKDLSLLLNKYQINDLHSFAQFVKSKFMHMLGFSQFLYSKYSEYKNIEDIMPFELSELVSTKELYNFIIEKGYSSQRYYKSKDILIEKNIFIPYNNDIFLNLKKFEFSHNVELKILEELKVVSEGKLFITKKELEKIQIELDDSLMVTPEIITHIANSNGYYSYEAYHGSIYELPIITKQCFKTYDELVYTLVKEKFEGTYNEENLLSFLKFYGLINENADQVYFTIKESGYFTFDNLGFFKLNEGGVADA